MTEGKQLTITNVITVEKAGKSYTFSENDTIKKNMADLTVKLSKIKQSPN